MTSQVRVCRRGHERESTRPQCLVCRRIWRDANREHCNALRRSRYVTNQQQILQKRRIEYWKDPEKARAAIRLWQSKNREKFRDSGRKHRANNTAKCRAATRRWGKLNRARRRETARQWYANNRARFMEIVHRRTAKKSGATVADSPLISQMRALDVGACVYCGRGWTLFEKPTLDHQRALVNGGLHGPENIVLCCLSCNASKGSRDVDAWLLARHGAAGRQRFMVWCYRRHWWLESRRGAAAA